MKKRTLSKVKNVTHAIGDRHFIDNTACVVRFINNGMAWVVPATDDKDEPLIARHIAYATIDAQGKVVII